MTGRAPILAAAVALSVSGPAMAAPANTAVVDRFMTLVKKGDYRAAEALLSPSITWVNQKNPDGRKSLASSYTIYLALSDVQVGMLERAECRAVDDTEVTCAVRRNSLFGDGVVDLTERYFVSDGKITRIADTIPPQILRLGQAERDQ